MDLSIIIPAHNEEASVEATIKDIISKVDGIRYEILVVNDHSTDKTVEKVLSLREELAGSGIVLRLISTESDTNGFTHALKTGFLNARGGFVIPVMADSCDDAVTISDMYKKALCGYDIICGSRYMPGGRRTGGRFSQSFFSRAVGLTLRCLTGVPTWDSSNAFKMYRKAIFDFIDIKDAGFAVSMQILLKGYFSGLRITEVPTLWRAREAGESDFFLKAVMIDYFAWYFWALFKTPGFFLKKILKKDKPCCVKPRSANAVTYSRMRDINKDLWEENEEIVNNRR